ncbi:MAG: Spo0B domain-containing protein [Pelosinus sp.]|nr:Spo0B domain-containing protein [Pelosinus sp.]
MARQIPVVQEDQSEVCNELIRLLRLQKHDFINHFQVVHGLIQLGKIDRALQYIEDLAKDPALVANTLREYKPENCVLKER